MSPYIERRNNTADFERYGPGQAPMGPTCFKVVLILMSVTDVQSFTENVSLLSWGLHPSHN